MRKMLVVILSFEAALVSSPTSVRKNCNFTINREKKWQSSTPTDIQSGGYFLIPIIC